MKKIVSGVGILVLLVLFTVVLFGCSSSDPKALAKQTVDLTMEIASGSVDMSIYEKIQAIEEQVAGLSESDQAIYEEEVERLTAESVGSMFGF